MDAPNVPVEQSLSEPSPWLDIAEELEKIAEDLRSLVGEPAPGLFDVDIHPLRISHPPVPKEREATIEGVDAVALALLGKTGETRQMSGGSFHHGARGNRGAISLAIYNAVADPDAVDPDEEIARLRAENRELRALVDPPLHLANDGSTWCGIPVVSLNPGAGYTSSHDRVTCQDCVKAMPF